MNLLTAILLNIVVVIGLPILTIYIMYKLRS